MVPLGKGGCRIGKERRWKDLVGWVGAFLVRLPGGAILFLSFAGVLCALLVQPQHSSAANSNNFNSIWVAQTDRLSKLALADGATLLEIPSGNLRALAIDSRRNLVWAYGKNILHAYSFDGALVVSIPVSVPDDDDHKDDDNKTNRKSEDQDHDGDEQSEHDDEDGDAKHVALAVDQSDGAVWLAVRKSLFKYSLQGMPLVNTNLRDIVRSISFAQQDRTLWVATEKAVTAHDPAGLSVLALALGSSRNIEDIAFDPVASQLWVALKDGIQRFYTSGTVALTVALPKAKYLRPDGRGKLWVATGKRLLRMDEYGAILSDIVPFDGEGNIAALAADPSDGSAWIARDKRLRHVGADGRIVLDARRPKPIRALALNPDTIPPEISIDAPRNGSAINSARPTIQLRFSDVGTGVDPATLHIQANGNDIAVACDSTPATASCNLSQPLPEGVVEIAASVADFAGNRSPPASIRFTVDTVPPTITLTSPNSRHITGLPTVNVAGSLDEPAQLTLNSLPVSVGSNNGFSIGAVVLAPGENAFELVATDYAGNTSKIRFTVNLDNVPPLVVAPPDLVVEATALYTPVALGMATAIDNVAGLLIRPAPDQTGPFPLGAHVITWRATDAAGNTAVATQSIIVRDTTPPVLTVPAPATAPSTSPVTVDIGTATATDLFGPVIVINDAPSVFPIGVTTVNWTAIDANGNRVTATQTVTIDASLQRNGWGTPVLVGEQYGQNWIYKPKISVNANGNAIAVWETSTPLPSVWISRFEIDRGWSVPEQVNLVGTVAGSGDVAVDANGNAMVVWVQQGGAGADIWGDVGTDIWARRYVVGIGWEAPTLIERDDTVYKAPRVRMDSSGNAVVIWLPWDLEKRGSLVANRYEVGRGWGTPVEIVERPSVFRSIDSSEVLMDKNGNVTVIWTTCDPNPFAGISGIIWACYFPPYSLQTIRAVHYIAGEGWGSPQELAHTDKLGPQDMHAVVGANGNIVLVWSVNDGVFGTSRRDYIHVMAYTPATGWLPGPGILHGDNIDDYEYTPRVAMDADANFIVTWSSNSNDGNAVWAAHYSTSSFGGDGDLLRPSRVVRLDDAAGYFSRPEVAMDATGNAVVVWERGDQHQITGRYYKNLVDWGPIGRIDAGNGAYAVFPQVAMDSGGNATAVWYETGNIIYTDSIAVWANRYIVPQHNELPIANAGSDRTVDEGSVVALDGTGSVDPDGTVYRYAWSQTSGPAVILSDVEAARSVFTAPTVNADTVLTFELKVFDAFLATATDTVTITVHNLTPEQDKTPPVVFAPEHIYVGATGPLTDIQYFWQVYAFDNADGPLVPLPDRRGPFALGTHTIVWTATDSAGNVGTAVQLVTVSDARSPTLVVPPDITVISTIPIAVDIGTAQATDIFPVTIVNNAPEVFPVGITIVHWIATDANGNSAYANQKIKVEPPGGLTGWGEPEVISGGGDDAPAEVKLAIDREGSVIAVARAYDGIAIERYVPGRGWGEYTHFGRGLGRAHDPQVASNSAGNAIAVWAQAPTFGGIDKIYASRYFPGTGWSDPEIIDDSSIVVSTPQVAIDEEGNATVVWVQGYSAIYARRHIAGNGWEALQRLDQNAGYSGSLGDPEIVVDRNGNATVLWSQESNLTGYLYQYIYACRYAIGSGWSQAGRIEDVNGYAFGPQAVVDNVNNVIVVWHKNLSIYSARYEIGAGWTGASAIGGGTKAVYRPQIAIDPFGNTTAVWHQYRSSYLGIYVHDIWANRYSVVNGWGSPELVEMGAGLRNAERPQVAMDARGNAIVVWHQRDSDSYYGGSYSVLANRYALGAGWEGTQLVGDGKGGVAVNPQIVMDRRGDAVAAWTRTEGRGSRYGVWTNRYHLGGQAGGGTTPPVVTPPPDIVVEATAALTPVTLGTATAVDDIDGPLAPTPDRVGPFPVGTHKITWSAVDSEGGIGRAVQTVVVRDTTPPVIIAPPDIAEAGSGQVAITLGSPTVTDIAVPVIVSNNAPAFFPIGVTKVTWTATDQNGNSATAEQVITVTQSFTLSIVSPAPDAVVDSGAVLVTGTLEGPPNSGVTVNGIVATVDRSTNPHKFYAAVTLQPGAGTITAVVTAPDGTTLSRSVNITAAATSAVHIAVNPASGIAPLKVRFAASETGGAIVRRLEIDFDGNGTIDYAQDRPPTGAEYTYPIPGMYLAKVRAIDSLGQPHTSIHPILVESFSDRDAVLRKIYTGMLDRLRNGDIEGALAATTGGVREKYRAVFTALGSDLPTIVDQIGTLNAGQLSDEMAEYVVTREIGGQSRAFLIYFLRSEDGVWRIDGM